MLNDAAAEVALINNRLTHIGGAGAVIRVDAGVALCSCCQLFLPETIIIITTNTTNTTPTRCVAVYRKIVVFSWWRVPCKSIHHLRT